MSGLNVGESRSRLKVSKSRSKVSKSKIQKFEVGTKRVGLERWRVAVGIKSIAVGIKSIAVGIKSIAVGIKSVIPDTKMPHSRYFLSRIQVTLQFASKSAMLERGEEGIELGDRFAMCDFELFDRVYSSSKFLLKLDRRNWNRKRQNHLLINKWQIKMLYTVECTSHAKNLQKIGQI